jgi:hypothetical protein
MFYYMIRAFKINIREWKSKGTRNTRESASFVTPCVLRRQARNGCKHLACCQLTADR